MSKLGECPFCGAPDLTDDDEPMERDGVRLTWNEEVEIFAVECSACDFEGPPGATGAEAVAAWNRRASGWVPVSERLPEGIGIKRAGKIDGWDGKTRIPVLWPCGTMTLESPVQVMNDILRPVPGDAVPTHWHPPLPAPPSGAPDHQPHHERRITMTTESSILIRASTENLHPLRITPLRHLPGGSEDGDAATLEPGSSLNVTVSAYHSLRIAEEARLAEGRSAPSPSPALWIEEYDEEGNPHWIVSLSGQPVPMEEDAVECATAEDAKRLVARWNELVSLVWPSGAPVDGE